MSNPCVAYLPVLLCCAAFAYFNKIARCGGAPQASWDKRRHRNCFQTRPLQDTCAEVRGQLIDQTQRSEFTLALNLDMLGAGQSPVSVHAGTSQVDFEVDRPPPAACPQGDLLITMVKETVILYKKEFRKMKKSRISHWSESDENANWLRDCLWLCQACKRGFICRPM